MSTTIHAKLAKAMSLIPKIPKSGFNQHFKYSYVQESDILDALRDVLPEVGLSTYVSVTESNVEIVEKKTSRGVGTALVATCQVALTITDAESAESITITMPGYAEAADDKALYKAITGATKYAYAKGFAISIGDEPEAAEGIPQTQPPQPTQKATSPTTPKAAQTASKYANPDEVEAVFNEIVPKLKRTREELDDNIILWHGDEAISDKQWQRIFDKFRTDNPKVKVESIVKVEPTAHCVQTAIEWYRAAKLTPTNVKLWTKVELADFKAAMLEVIAKARANPQPDIPTDTAE